MLLKGLLVVATIIVGVAILGYQPIPEGIEDKFNVQLIVGLFNILSKIEKTAEFLGYKQIFKNLAIQSVPKGDPESAAFGTLKVTRQELAGVPAIVYQPRDTSVSHPAIVYFHGGGWVHGSPDIYDKMAFNYALQTGTALVSVGYRLAPRHPFPAPVNDCLDVTRFVLRHGSKYGIDVTKVGVAGDSAGGNLAAAVALKLSREKSDLPPLLFQVLHYPALQMFDMHLPSLAGFNNSAPVLTLSAMSSMYALYIGLEEDNNDYYTAVISENRHIPAHLRKSKYAEFVDVKLLPAQYQPTTTQATSTDHDSEVYAKIKDIVTNPLFSPLMSPDVSGLPPAFIHVSEFDVLRDDGLLYARRLQDAGVKTEVHFGKGGFHGDVAFTSGAFFQMRFRSGETALSAAFTFIRTLVYQ